MWDRWRIDGQTSPPDMFIRPWTDEAVTVIGAELMKLRNRGWLTRFLNRDREWFMVGSTIVPDAMIWLGPGESRHEKWFPPELFQAWPSKTDAKPVSPLRKPDGKIYAAGGDLIDLHGQCYGGSATVFLTLYYLPKSKVQP